MSEITIPADLAEVIRTHRELFGGFTMTSTPPEGGGDDGHGADGSPTTFTQEQVNAFLAEDRRKNAARFADYDDLKAKASEYDKAQEASKTELQKAIDRAAAAEKERDDLKAAEKARIDKEAHEADRKKWREAAAKKHGIPADVIQGNTEDEIGAHAEQLAKLLPRKGHVPREGELPAGDGKSELREFARQLFNND